MNTINFLYFAYNFSNHQLVQCLDNTGQGKHFLYKFNYILSVYNNSTVALLELMMQMGDDNKQKVIEWIENNYNYRGKHS